MFSHLHTYLPIISHNIYRGILRLHRISQKLSSYIGNHPYLFAAQTLGISISFTSLLILPILGFGTVGPIAGSIAAGWQSSIGAVSANSLFALLQSAGMGGPALMSVTGIGIGGVFLLFMASIRAVPRNVYQGAGESALAGLLTYGKRIKNIVRNSWRSWWRD